MQNLSHLKSGSDIRGKAFGENAEITKDLAAHVGNAFVQFVSNKYTIDKDKITIAIGRDSRITGETLAHGIADGIMSAGANAVYFGMCTTPAMYQCLLQDNSNYNASIMVTASHHPYDRNGFKFFLKEGGLNSNDIEVILKYCYQDISLPSNNKNIPEYPYIKDYKNSIKDMIQRSLGHALPLKGLHIIVDAGNGAGGFYADLLSELGANISGSQFIEPDGYFPNHIPNPENKEAMDSISSAVIKNNADLGIIFDADCDRAAIVDSNGKEINRNRLIAMISAILLENNKNISVVTDSVTSTGLAKFIEQKGGHHIRFKRGYRNVIDEAIRLNSIGIDAPIAMETSGHCALRENSFIDDGMYLVTKLIIKAMELQKKGKKLGDLIKDLEEPLESAEIRLNINSADFRNVGNSIIESVEKHYEKINGYSIAEDSREGLRVYYDYKDTSRSVWFMLRVSVHDPVMPINIESDIPGGLQFIKSDLMDYLKSFKDLSI